MKALILVGTLGFAWAAADEKLLDPEKDLKSTKKISEAEKNLPKTVNLKVSKYETESFDFFCPKVNRAAILTIYYEEENSDEGFLAKTKVVQRWGGVWESNPRIEVNEDGGLHTQITITDLTLDDKGFYFCEVMEQQKDKMYSSLTELIMWAKPERPVITKKDFYYSQETKSNTTTQDYSLPQDLLKCSSAKGFPEPRLRWLDSLGNAIPASQTISNCFPHAVRQAVFDCDLILKLPVTRYMDGASYTCELSHEAYRDGPVTVDKSIVVHYPPTEVVMKGNKTDSTIHCTSKSKPASKYFIKLGSKGAKQEITNANGKLKIDRNVLSQLPENDFVYCIAENGVSPAGQSALTVEELFAAEPLLATMHWIIIAAGAGALIIVLIIVICCCCRKKKDQKFENPNKKTYKQGNPTKVNIPYNNTGTASSISREYNYNKNDYSQEPQNTVEEYLRRAHSKERLMDDDRGSSVPSQFDDQLQRTREAISRSRQHLDQIEEIEITNDHLRKREDSFDNSFDETYDQKPPSYNAPNPPQYNQYYDDDQSHFYQNDPSYGQSKPYQQNYHEDEGPPPPPRNASYRLV